MQISGIVIQNDGGNPTPPDDGNGEAGPVKSGIASPAMPPRSGLTESNTDPITFDLTFSMIASFCKQITTPLPTTVNEIIPLAIAMALINYCIV